ncbi:hypothetical protein ACGFK1_00925 [Mycobacterium sp. NPDC048908]
MDRARIRAYLIVWHAEAMDLGWRIVRVSGDMIRYRRAALCAAGAAT